jgi:hypothetical protein|nr:MAG TPA: hypothetical protein [Caudoviricetes sp.]
MELQQVTPQAKKLISILEHAKDLTYISQEAARSYIDDAILKITHDYVII